MAAIHKTEIRIYNDRVLRVAVDRIKSLPTDGSVVVVIKPAEDKRSLAQNALSWIWYGEMAKETGHSVQDIHDICCRQFLGVRVIERFDGSTFEALNTTRDLKVKPFTEYLERVDAWAAELGFLLSRPQDVYYRAMGFI